MQSSTPVDMLQFDLNTYLERKPNKKGKCRVYDFLWSKRRRCMNHRKVEKLAFNYINSGLLDTTDNRDYFGDDFNSFDMDIDSSNESDLEDQEMDTCGELNIAAGEERGSEAEEQENDHYLMDEGFDFEDL